MLFSFNVNAFNQGDLHHLSCQDLQIKQVTCSKFQPVTELLPHRFPQSWEEQAGKPSPAERWSTLVKASRKRKAGRITSVSTMHHRTEALTNCPQVICTSCSRVYVVCEDTGAHCSQTCATTLCLAKGPKPAQIPKQIKREPTKPL